MRDGVRYYIRFIYPAPPAGGVVGGGLKIKIVLID